MNEPQKVSVEREKALLCAIVQQAIDDMSWRGRVAYVKKGKNKGMVSPAYTGRIRNRHSAYAWFFNSPGGMPVIAEWIDLDVVAAREAMVRKLARLCVDHHRQMSGGMDE